jgi:hypothetical protein
MSITFASEKIRMIETNVGCREGRLSTVKGMEGRRARLLICYTKLTVGDNV